MTIGPPARGTSTPTTDAAIAVQMMVGRSLDGLYPRNNASPGDVVLDVKGLSCDGSFRDVSFQLRAGEILGFGGLVGSGRTEIARVLFGIDQPS